MVQVSSRAKRLIRVAERTLPLSRQTVVTPIDLFVGGLYEQTGVLGEFFLRGRFDMAKLEQQRDRQVHDGPSTSMLPFAVPASQALVSIFRRADELRHAYGQGVITEGNLYSALLELNEIKSLLKYSTAGMTKNEILEIVCSPRDMVVPLRGFAVYDSMIGDMAIRRAKPTESEAVINFVKQEFGERWVQHTRYAFTQDPVALFIGVDNDVRGFACYNVVRKKQGTIGPMGIAKSCRQSGIGRVLLQQCLAELEHLNYDYAVINNAGPIEFYERACGAVVIPKSQ